MKTALVTGGARGIGRAIAEAFAADHHVALTYNATPPTEVLRAYPDVFAVQADLGQPANARSIVAAVLERFGALDVLVNNAGAIEMTPLDAVDPLAEARNLAVNLTAPMALLSAALPHLTSGASVVNISSVNAVLPAMGGSGYSASKAAMNTWTKGRFSKSLPTSGPAKR